MVNAKRKGNAGENKWANWLRDHGIRAWKDGGSGGGTREKSDVGNDIEANFEVKTVSRVNLLDAWKQSKKAADQAHTTPYVIIHYDGMREDEWLVVMNNYDWLDLLLGESKTEAKLDPSLKYKLSRLREDAQAIIKLIGNV